MSRELKPKQEKAKSEVMKPEEIEAITLRNVRDQLVKEIHDIGSSSKYLKMVTLKRDITESEQITSAQLELVKLMKSVLAQKDYLKRLEVKDADGMPFFLRYSSPKTREIEKLDKDLTSLRAQVPFDDPKMKALEMRIAKVDKELVDEIQKNISQTLHTMKKDETEWRSKKKEYRQLRPLEKTLEMNRTQLSAILRRQDERSLPLKEHEIETRTRNLKKLKEQIAELEKKLEHAQHGEITDLRKKLKPLYRLERKKNTKLERAKQKAAETKRELGRFVEKETEEMKERLEEKPMEYLSLE